jgi:serine/threonine-protein kinase
MDRETLGHYKIEAELGRGGMGVVYKGFDPTLNRHVAIKVLAEALAHDESVVERFVREAKSMAALNDPHIIQIFYIGEDEGTPYFAMEYVTGESLSQRLKRDGKLSVEAASKILIETAEGLATAHSKGVVHRDIKPGNLMINDRGRVKIADFGIAMVQDYSKRLTNTGEFVGTPGYLSPEVCIGQQVDQRSDIFALGIVFFEMLTGQIPFTEVSPLGMMLEVVKADIPDVRTINADVDERTCNILKRMIAKDPEQRYQTCDELLTDLTGNAPVRDLAVPASSEPSSFQAAATSALNLIEASPDDDSPQPQTMISSPGQVMSATEEPEGSSSMLPMAIAAVLFLGIAAGSLYLFKDTILGTEQSPGEQSINLAKAVESDQEDQSPAASDEVEARQTGAQEMVDSAASSASLAVSTETPSQAQAGNQGSADAAPGPLEQAPASVSTQQASEPVTVARKSAATESRPAELQLAKVTSPPTQTPVSIPEPAEPRVVVVAIGDRSIAGPVEQILEQALAADGHVLMDEAFFDGIGRVASDQGVDLPGLSQLIQQNGASVLVLAQIDYLGETGLEYYGQYSTLYSVNLKVRNILLSERRSIGSGWQQKVDFTSLNAGEKAQEAVEPFIDQLTASLKQYRG